MPLGSILEKQRVVVCVGSGGVGKTTIAAAIAVQAASEGRRVLVCTIDPARRLANSLGLAELGNVETPISKERMVQAGVPGDGQLFAMMLDLKRTWDELVLRHVSDAGKREAILRNRFYMQLSTSLVGSQEYMAMEKLYELREDRDYDMVVLDTPPTVHALDFLEAPNRVLDVLGNDAARWLLAPALKAGTTGLKFVNLGSGYFARTISRLTGVEALQAVAELMLSFSVMYDGFKERAERVKALLASRETAFVLVSSPNSLAIDEAIHFHTLLGRNQMGVAAAVVNRVAPNLFPDGRLPGEPEIADFAASVTANAPDPGSKPLSERLKRTMEEADALARADRQQIGRLRNACGTAPVLEIPRFEADVHDLSGLWHVAHFLGAG
jgi:anion-transporting  ArsA/GET3 family ATPase